MELWEVLDDNGNPTGEIMEKYDKKVFDKGLYHLGADVWIDTYILKCNYDISNMKFQAEEVSDAKWATWSEINTLVNNGEFIKHRWKFVNKFLKDELEETNGFLY